MDVSYPKQPSLQNCRPGPSLLPCNSRKRLNAEGEDFAGSSLPKRMRLEKPKLTLNTKPSRSIPPPTRSGSLQTAFLASEDDDVKVTSKVEDISSTDIEYTYSPLQRGEFRLLRLHPGQRDDDEISCSLVTDSIHSPSAYEALSYAWGERSITRLISLSDENDSATFTSSRPYEVGSNLYNALLALRLSDRPLILWVDALCIDQSNIEERCTQVAMMATIYQNAHRTIVCLGTPDIHSDRVFSNLHGLLNPGFFSNQGRKTDDSRELTASTMWSSFSHLCSRPYFSRMWVVQELALAADITFVCGKHQVDIKDLRAVAELFVQWRTTNNIGRHVSTVERASTILS